MCFCVHRLPYPPIAGGRTETFELLSGLAENGHDVAVVSYGADRELADEMERAAGCAVELVRGQPDRTVANLAGNLLSFDPLPVTKARNDRYTRAVLREIPEADVLHLHAIQTSFIAADGELSIPTVIRFNNVKYPIYRQYARHGTRNPAKSAYAYLQYLKARRYERRLSSEADLTLTITPEDRDLLSEPVNGRIDVLPAGVDLEGHQPSGDEADGLVTFFGSMDYHPNEDAARWFARKVFPELRSNDPDLTFQIVGKNPPASIEQLGNREGIEVTGFVDDIDEYIDQATVVVIPIRVGTGVRLKVLHAMAMEKAVVSTPLGVQGIQVEDGVHAAIAGSADEFASRTAALLSDPEERTRLGTNARRLMAEEHDWPTIIGQLEDYYEVATARGKTAS